MIGVLATARKYDEAEAHLARAIELQPRNPAAHAANGALLAARDQPDRGATELALSLELNPEQDDVRLDLARTLEQLGRGAAAQTEYRRLADGRETPPEIRAAARARLRR